MCRIVYIVEGRPLGGQETYNAGDVVTVEDDGTFLGREVEPATSTGGNLGVIEVPGAPASQMRYLMRVHQDTLAPLRVAVARPGHPEGDRYERNIIRKRQYGIDRRRVAASQRANWRPGRVITDTKANIENAVRDHTRPGNPPVDPTTIPRRGGAR